MSCWKTTRLSLSLCFLGAAQAGFPAEIVGRDQPAADALNQLLPEWLRFSGEYRLRMEGFQGLRFQPDNDDAYALNRVRLNLRIQPVRKLKLFFQAQDARVFANSRIADAPPYQDRLDLRQAWVELGDSDAGFAALKVGRQELSFGDERLVGPSNWANTARSFDAVKLTLHRPGSRVQAFAASVVNIRDGELNHHVQGDNLHGLAGEFEKLLPRSKVEPYLFWRVAPRVRAETGAFGKADVKTFGVRLTGEFGRRFQYATELAGQTGFLATDRVRSWAGHGRLGYKTGSSRWAPLLRPEYDFATGDRDPADGKHGTFELPYPTPHDKYGLADQVGWKNIHHLGVTAEWKPRKGWTGQLRHHEWWLANRHDGLYNAGGTLLIRDVTGQSGRFVGREWDLQAQWNASKQIYVGGGIGHIFPGEFLKRASPGSSYTWSYCMITYGF